MDRREQKIECRAVWNSDIELPETEVRVWSPLREACIHTGPGETKRRIALDLAFQPSRLMVGSLTMPYVIWEVRK